MKYAMNLEMKGRPCLVLGGGPVALRKARTLLRAEAAVTVAAPRLTEELADLAAAGRLRWRAHCYEETMLAGMFLVVCATDDRAANEAAARAARARGVLVNAPAQPELSDFTVPASLARGRLLLTVSTDGLSPALSRAIRAQLETLYPEALGDWLERLAAVRRELKAETGTARAREAFWRRAMSAEILDMVRQGRSEEAEERIRHAAHLFRIES